MTHGRIVKTRVNRRNKKRSTLLTRFPETLQKALETRLANLEARVTALEQGTDGWSGIPTQFYQTIENTGKKRRGPRERIDDSELLIRRDAILEWLEQHWTVISPLIRAAKNPRDVATALRKVARSRDIRPEWQSRFVGHPAQLLDFLRSEKFRIKPPKKTVVDALRAFDSEKRRRAANRLPTRQIANAMAGVPKLKWRTSLDRCSKNPSSYRVGHSTDRHYRAMFGIVHDKPD